MAETGVNVKKGDVFGKLVALEDDKFINGRRYALCKCECGTERYFRTDRLISGITYGCGCVKSPRIEELIGKKYGHLTILGLDKETHKHKYVVCLCDCGKTTIKSQFKILRGEVTSCGKCKSQTVCIGDIYGEWRVIGDSIRRNGRNKWLCQCSCDEHVIRYVEEYSLKSGKSTSCGCKNRKVRVRMGYKYTESETRLHQIYWKMCNRCNNSNSKDYEDYGGRGIKICEEWENDINAFIKWALDNGYADTLTIERVNVNGNYEPSNCRWADRMTQGNNKRNNLYIEHDGITHTATEWGRILNIRPSCIYRYYHEGLSLEEIIKKKGVSV